MARDLPLSNLAPQRHWLLQPDCEVSFDADVPCIVMTWQGYLTSEQFRAANERVLEFIKVKRCPQLLGDITDFTLITAEDQRWLNENWIPRAIAAGLRVCALVQPVYYFNQVAVENVTQAVERGRLDVRHFADVESARRFLRSARPGPGKD
jgi:hypothetical protein